MTNPHPMDFAHEICICGCRFWLAPSHPHLLLFIIGRSHFRQMSISTAYFSASVLDDNAFIVCGDQITSRPC